MRLIYHAGQSEFEFNLFLNLIK